VDMLKPRPLQFCIFLSTLLGQKQMETHDVVGYKEYAGDGGRH
jgi:hypothetical protein